MRAHDVDPGHTAMAVILQRMVEARAAGGALSRPEDGGVVVTGTWGLGSALAQGEVVPDRWTLGRDGSLESVEPGRKDRLLVAAAAGGARPEAGAPEPVPAPRLAPAGAVEPWPRGSPVATTPGGPLPGERAQAGGGCPPPPGR